MKLKHLVLFVICLFSTDCLSAQLSLNTNFWGTKYFDNGKRISRSDLHEILMSNEADREDFLSYRRAQRNLNASTIIGGLLIGAGLYTNKKSLPYYGGAIVSGIFGLLFQSESGIQMQKMMDDYNEKKGLSSYRLDVIPGKMVISF